MAELGTDLDKGAELGAVEDAAIVGAEDEEAAVIGDAVVVDTYLVGVREVKPGDWGDRQT